MVVPGLVGHAASTGDLAVVEAWLDEAGPGAVDDVCVQGYTCLIRSVAAIGEVRERVEIVRFLISCGADVNLCSPDAWTPLHWACFQSTGSTEMVSLLLQAGARSVLEARTPPEGMEVYPDSTPLGTLLHSLRDADEEYGGDLSNFRGSLIALLRAGASLHNCSKGKSAIIIMRDHLMKRATLADDEHYIACREILAGVNAQGSYKRYVRAPHREFLRFRSLLVRGRAKTNGLNERIARLPNGACWKVLSYWREDN